MTLVLPQGNGSLVHSLRWAGDPDPMAVTVGVQTDAATIADLQDVVDIIAQAFVDNFLPVMINDIELVQTELRFQLDALPAAPVIVVSTITDAGAITSNSLPQNNSFLLHKRTNVGGRAGRGRMYFPGVAEGNVDNLGNLDGTLIGQWNTAGAGYLADCTVAGPINQGLVLLHDSEGAHAGDDPHLLTQITVDPVIATQRRRLRH